MDSNKSILDIFPTELLSIIKSHIPLEDLRTNVCFYRACHLFAALFGPEVAQVSFWENSCLLSGLGCLPGETPHTVSWKSIAFECIVLDGFCDHPECGGARLNTNAHEMSKLGILHSEWSHFSDLLDQEDESFSGPVTSNPIFGHLAFQTDFPDGSGDEGEDAILCYPDPSGASAREGPLCSHPIACRSFATFHPMRQMLFRPLEIDDAINLYGLTVWDIQATLQEHLDQPVSISLLIRYLEHAPDYRSAFPPGCDILEVLNALQTLRGFLSYFGLNGLKLEYWDHRGPTFSVLLKHVRTMRTVEAP